MWGGINASYNYNGAWTWKQITKSLSREGLSTEEYTEYTGIKLQFLRSSHRVNKGGDGYFSTNDGIAIVPSKQLDDLGIVVSTKDSLLSRGNDTYRIESFEDYSDLPNMRVYELRLNRWEDYAH